MQDAIYLGSLSTDPATPMNGMIWYNSTLGKFRKRENGVTSDLDTTGGGGGGITAGVVANINKYNIL